MKRPRSTSILAVVAGLTLLILLIASTGYVLSGEDTTTRGDTNTREEELAPVTPAPTPTSNISTPTVDFKPHPKDPGVTTVITKNDTDFYSGAGGFDNPTTEARVRLNSTKAEKKTLEYINKYRAKHGLKKFEWNDSVASHARAHAYHLAMINETSHDDIKEYILSNTLTGENVYSLTVNSPWGDSYYTWIRQDHDGIYDSADLAKSAIAGWKNSSEHNKLLLATTKNVSFPHDNTNFDKLAGVGVYFDRAPYNDSTHTKNGSPFTMTDEEGKEIKAIVVFQVIRR